MISENKDRYKEKALHGMFFVNTTEGRDASTWTQLSQGDSRKESEGMIVATQDQALRTRHICKEIDKEDIPSECRLCSDREENIAHIMAECRIFAQKQ